MRIILEGPDKCGKTTLAKIIAEKYKIKYLHCSKPKTDNPFEEYKQMLIDNPNSVWDRGYLGEFVYANLWRGGCKITSEQFHELDDIAESTDKTLIIFCKAKISDIKKRCISDNEELLQQEQICDCLDLFSDITFHTKLHVVNYNSSYSKPEELLAWLESWL